MFIEKTLKDKSHISWSIIAAIIVISVIYIQMTTMLLHSNNENIVFVEKELKGLSDYKKTITSYFELPIKEQKEAGKTFRDSIREIGDRSNLILDPSLESYYVISILFNHIPKLASTTNLPKDNAEYYFEDLNHAVHILAQKNLSTQQIKKYVEQLKKEPAANRQEVPTQVQELSKIAVSMLNQLLQNRLIEQKKQHSISLAIITGLYFALIFSVVFAIRNYVTKREINSAIEKQKLLSKLAEKNEELERFTYAAAHDLREPVRTICCFTALLKKEAGQELGTSGTEYTNIIERTAKRAEQMLNDLLNYARLSEEPFTLENCDCALEISSALEDLKSSIEIAKPNIIIGKMPIIQTIPSLFRRIMLNLIDNAIKYRKDNIVLEIYMDVGKKNGGWLFSVKDNGIGIDAAHIDLVFQPFKRLYPNEYIGGEGIGLTSCKKIVEILGGKIWVSSEAEIGTTVYFTIPAR